MTLGRFGPQGLTYPDGKPARSQWVTCCPPGTTTHATVYSSAQQDPLNNPMRTDSQGNLWFYAEAGAYDLLVNDQVISVTIDPPSPGPAGDPGKSAYQIALENGFVGTEAEWLASLGGGGGGLAMVSNRFTHRAQLHCTDTADPSNWSISSDPDGLIGGWTVYPGDTGGVNFSATKAGIYLVSVVAGFESAYSTDVTQGSDVIIFKASDTNNAPMWVHYIADRPTPPAFGAEAPVLEKIVVFAPGDTYSISPGAPAWFGVPVYCNLFVMPLAVLG